MATIEFSEHTFSDCAKDIKHSNYYKITNLVELLEGVERFNEVKEILEKKGYALDDFCSAYILKVLEKYNNNVKNWEVVAAYMGLIKKYREIGTVKKDLKRSQKILEYI